MNWQTLFTSLVTLLVGIGMAFIGYYVRTTAQNSGRLEKKQDDHEKKDDDRFEKLTLKLEAVKGNELIYEKLDAMKDDNTNKRHALRAEVREALHLAAERGEHIEERLMREIARLEMRIPKPQ